MLWDAELVTAPHFLLAALVLLHGPAGAAAQPIDWTRLQPKAEPKCNDAPDLDAKEIVVCGKREEDSRYRIPDELIDLPSTESRHASWDVQVRDAEALERFSNQNDGRSGISRHSRQIDCEWRVARQQIRGARPDCGEGIPF